MRFNTRPLRFWYQHLRRRTFEAVASDRYSHLALNDLDHKLKKYLDFDNGFFIEVGGNDGLAQSNTYWFERFRGWRGILVEAVPDQARMCAENRPLAQVVSAALVADDLTKSVKIKSARLMSFISGAKTPDAETTHLNYAVVVQRLAEVPEIEVPAMTLAALLDKRGGGPVDLFSLDVEGYEVQVLQGMNPDKHRPRLILVETQDLQRVLETLKGHYREIAQLSHHDYLLGTDNPS